MKARLAQCLRCKAYTLLGAGVVDVAVDVAPLGRDGYIGAVVRRDVLYSVEKRQNGGQELLAAPPGSLVPSWDESGAQAGTQRLHAEHGCAARHQRPVSATAGPPSAPATPGGHRGGNHQPDAPEGAPRPSSRATHVIRPPSKPTRCGICDKMIVAGQSWWGFEHSTTVYAEHEECP